MAVAADRIGPGRREQPETVTKPQRLGRQPGPPGERPDRHQVHQRPPPLGDLPGSMSMRLAPGERSSERNPGLLRAKVPRGSDGRRAVAYEVQLAEKIADVPGDVVPGTVSLPADDVDFPARPVQDPLELLMVQGGAREFRARFEDAVDHRHDDLPGWMPGDRLVVPEPSPRTERVERSQPFVTVPAARMLWRNLVSRGNPAPGGLLLAAQAREFRSEAEVDRALCLKQVNRRQQEPRVSPRPLDLGLEI